MEEHVILYHGSKSGISGPIAPISRDKCDFGKGFYMGTEKEQPLTLICNYENSELYTLNLNLTGLKIKEIDIGIEWALLIAFNRGKLEHIRGMKLYKQISEMTKGCDIVIGSIADDRMFVVLDRFFSGDITDTALIRCLSALKLGKQYAALTEKACSRIEITDVCRLSEENRRILKEKSEINRSEGISMAEKICREYRREGRFFDEIVNEQSNE